MKEIKDLNEIAASQFLLFRFGPIWDGNLNSKSARDVLVDLGLIARHDGFQFLTAKGIDVLIKLGKLNQDSWREHPGFKGKTNYAD